MADRTTLNGIKEAILKKRRQRIRRSTYGYVADLIIEDTALDHPFRDRMVIDWWNRVVDPLEADGFDKERLRYFRERLSEHRRSAPVNAAIRQELDTGKPLRRLRPDKYAYMRHQVKRMTDRRLNYAAADRAFDENDQVFERLVLGLMALPRLNPGPNSFLDQAAWRVTKDERWKALLQRLSDDPGTLLPGIPVRKIEERISKITNRLDPIWLHEPDYLEVIKEAGLIRKLEEEYMILLK